VLLSCLVKTRTFAAFPAVAAGTVFRELVHDVLTKESHWLSPIVQMYHMSPPPLLMLQAWDPPTAQSNLHAGDPRIGVLWTISTLMFSWACYPLFGARLRVIQTSHLLWFAVFTYILSMALPLISYHSVCLMNGDCCRKTIVMGSFTLVRYVYIHPASRFLDFLVGAASAEVLARLMPRVSWKRAWGYVADLAILSIVYLAATEWLNLWQGYHCMCTRNSLTPLLALFLLASSLSDKSLSAQLFSHPVLSSLGEYSLAVYMFQEVWADMYFRNDAAKHKDENALAAAYVAEFLGGLWLFAALWIVWVDRPIQRVLSNVLKGDWLSTPDPALCGSAMCRNQGALRRIMLWAAYKIGLSKAELD